ncbi:NUDIX domain-containing protein [Streptomyces sp. NBC_01239]|uniref:NUDIX domain-containing protein n=1 Tax=Streptomyces sp. NBC_01239 TaxID=2903792 RepID=UPI0022548F69|nr:NUDIX domain-containing protein [Streptomyces sp. NBC_01239]MCX4812775.1 NUDIX domain-containing protein [Streptomyces sp. NBC_01239]
MTLLVAAVIVRDKATNRVVLLQRSQTAKFAQGMWELPFGRTEPGEPITGTAVRELCEEVGLTVKPESLKVAHIIHSASSQGLPERLPHRRLLRLRVDRRTRKPRTCKHAQVRWVDTDAMPEAFVDTTASALHCYLDSGPQVSLDGRE